MTASLPHDGAVAKKLNPDWWWWTPEIEFDAGVIERLDTLNWYQRQCKGPKPKPVKRPSDKQPVMRFSSTRGFDTPDEFDAWRSARLRP